MKKRIIYALCCALMLTGLVGCNNNNSESSQQTQQNETTAAQQIETTTPQEDLKKETSDKENKTKESSDKDAEALYKEVSDNMHKTKNYHTEQKMIVETTRYGAENASISFQTSINVVSDCSSGKTDDGKPCKIIHSKTNTSVLGKTTNSETYEMQDPNNVYNYYACYEKKSSPTNDTEPKWKDKVQTGESTEYNHLYLDSIKNIKFNEKESTSKIKVLEGNFDELLSRRLLETSKKNYKVETKIKIKIDAVNKVILENAIYFEAETDSTASYKTLTTAKSVQKFSKINNNIAVEIPNAVKEEAKQSSESDSNDTDSSFKVFAL